MIATDPMPDQLPSRRRLLAATRTALVVAAVLFTGTRLDAQICSWGGTTSEVAPAAAFLRSRAGPFETPGRVAVDSFSNLYVTDPAAGRVVVTNALGRLASVREGFARPFAVAVDSLGTIYLSELDSGSVSVFDSAWGFVEKLGVGDGEFVSPNDIAIDPLDDSVLVSDGQAHVVKVFDSAGALVRTLGGQGAAAGQFELPAAVHVTDAGEIFVADQNNDRIQVFSRDGTFLRCFGQQPGEGRKFGRVAGLTTDSTGRLYVADGFQGQIVVFDTQGVQLATLASFGPLAGELETPLGLAIDTLNRLFVSSHNAGTVDVFGIDSYSDPAGSDPAGSLQFDSAAVVVTESSGHATIDVTRSGGSSGLVMAKLRAADGTATAGSDFEPVATTVIFGDGDTTPQSVQIPIRDDTRHEGDETVQLTLSEPVGGATLGLTAAELTVQDDDLPLPGVLEFDSPTYAAVEHAGLLIATVTRAGGSDGAVSVEYSATGLGAEAGLDYLPPTGTVTFADGDSEPKSFSLVLVDDAVFEGQEALRLNLSQPTGGATIGTTADSLVTILDNDLAPPPCPSVLLLANHVVVAPEEFVASSSVEAGDAFRVASPGGSATFRAGIVVTFANGFEVENGATLSVFVGSGGCGAGV